MQFASVEVKLFGEYSSVSSSVTEQLTFLHSHVVEDWNVDMQCLSYVPFFHLQYQAAAAIQSADFPTPLSQAECVSLVMAYELCRTAQSESEAVTFLEWIVHQLDSGERKPACQFAVSSNICGSLN